MDPITIIKGIVSLIALFATGYKINKEGEVASAIRMVERKVGLTDDVKWAWAWFDRRYPELDLGDSWKGYCSYADHTIKWYDDVAHWQDVTQHCLDQIMYYLEEAMYKWQLEHPGDVGYEPEGILEFLKKNAKYLLLGGAALALIVVLASGGRPPVYIVKGKE